MRYLGLVLLLTLPAMAAPPDFEKEVWPIFRKKCFVCHNATLKQNGLRLDDGASALEGGYSGPAIVPGKSGESKLIARVITEKVEERMPKMGPPLTPAEVATLRAWIDGGASWPRKAAAAGPAKPLHWAFQPIGRPAPPVVKHTKWVRNEVDRFVLARLEKEGIAPSPEAARTTLIRRVTLDLTGLPPTPVEVRAFLADERPDAYERLVDRLLSSPHFGERWARHWLDLARYADSDGYEKDNERPIAWRWRDWVIEALNRDMPFDRFTVEQLAGDLLPAPTMTQLIATGFQRNTLTNREGGTDPKESRFEQLVNRTNTAGTVWLGLTVGCAQCHDHKYDPISQKEFYSLYAFFDRSEEVDIEAPLPGETGPRLRHLAAYQESRKHIEEIFDIKRLQREWEKQMIYTLDHPGANVEWDFSVSNTRPMFDRFEATLRTPPGERSEYDEDRMLRWFIRNPGPDAGRDPDFMNSLREFRRRLAALDDRLPRITRAPAMMELSNPPRTHLAVKGDYREAGIPVEPGTLSVLPPLPEGPRNRLALARWLVSKENPLTARVTVNRLWQELWGRGLVLTSEDFGTQGEAPTHPELLDWLAGDFMDHGWSLKRTLRTIVTSAAYRQSSHARLDLKDTDPGNTLLARQSRLRLPAEAIRDAALAASGLLNDSIGGPSVKPPQPEGVAELVYAGSAKWKEDEGPGRYRRGLYVHFQRTAPYPMLMNFDAPDSNVACSRRRRSNSPLQALNLLNDPVFYEAAQAFAYRLLGEAETGRRIEEAFLHAVGRAPTEIERARMLRLLDEQATALAVRPDTGAKLLPAKPEQAAWVTLARVLLNLDEFTTRE